MRDIKERINFFESNYAILPVHISKGKKIYIGERTNRYCRFCGHKEPEVKFRNTAHALPEFLGNKQLISLQECDECNTFFSENIEVHLDKFTRPFRTIAQIRGKAGVPSYKTKDKKSRIDFDKDKGLISLETLDQRISDIDREKKKVTFNFDYEPYIPSAVYKSLVKMALSIMPEDELQFFKHSIKWILNPDHSKKLITPQILRAIFIPGPNPNRILTVFLLRKKQNSTTEGIPFCMLVIGFGNLVLQLVIPSSNDKSGSLIIPFFPTPFEIGGKLIGLSFMRFDLSSHEIVTGKKEVITFSYDGIEEIKE